MISVIHTDGSGDDYPAFDVLSDLYDELSVTDSEHPDVSVVNEDWYISAYKSGLVILGNEKDEPRNLRSVPKERVLELWKKLIEGDIDGLLSEHWNEGYR